MKTLAGFEVEEYQKLMETLGLMGRDLEQTEENTSDYFNAWHFGQPDELNKLMYCTTLQHEQ